MIDLGEQVFFGDYTDENGARRMLKEAAKKRCHGIDESRIKLIIKKDRGYITGAWHVKVKEKEYIRILEEQNAELVRKTEQLERERDAAVTDIHRGCSTCKHYYYNRQDGYMAECLWVDDCTIEDHWEWRGVPESPKEDT